MKAFAVTTRESAGSSLVRLVVGLAFALLAYDNGTFGLERRNAVGIVVWAIVIVLVGFGLWTVRPTRSAVAALAVLGGFAAWTLASLFWTPSAEWTFGEFDRVATYAGVFLLGLFAGRRLAGAAVDGAAAAITAVCAAALVSRFFPSVFPDRGLISSLPDAGTRLSFPLGYWNGLAIFAALGVPLVLARASGPRASLARIVALAPAPVLFAVTYLASSRGGLVAAAVGVLCLLALGPDRWLTLAATLVAVGGAALELVFLRTQRVIVDGPLGTHAASAAGHRAAALTLVACLATAAGWALVLRLLGERRPARALGVALTAAVCVALVAAVALSHPGERLASFKQPPGAVSFAPGDFTGNHLASGAGSGRWQFWSAAVDQWQAHPVLGEGAGTFAAWWLQHGSIDYYVRDAHSLYLQTFGELGLVGGLLVLAFVAIGLVGAARCARADGANRLAVAAAASAFAAFAAGAALDWVWQLPAVAIPALALLGVALTTERPSRPGRVGGLGLGLLVAGWLVVIALVLPFVARVKIDASQTAARNGDLAAARSAADTARSIQPWAASPYLQLALVDELDGRLGDARREIRHATANNPVDWRLWLVRTRIETKLGAVADARASLARGRALYPRSRLFAAP